MAETIRIEFALTKDETYVGELEDVTLDVKAELEQRNIVVDEAHRINEGKLGPEWLPVLSLVLSAPAILLAVQAIRDVAITALSRTPTIILKIKNADKESELTIQNINEKASKDIIKELALS